MNQQSTEGRPRLMKGSQALSEPGLDPGLESLMGLWALISLPL